MTVCYRLEKGILKSGQMQTKDKTICYCQALVHCRKNEFQNQDKCKQKIKQPGGFLCL